MKEKCKNSSAGRAEGREETQRQPVGEKLFLSMSVLFYSTFKTIRGVLTSSKGKLGSDQTLSK